MPAWSRILVEPIFRLMFGRPLADRLPGSNENEDHNEMVCRGLVIVVGGVGGLDLCGMSMRYVMAAERLPYAVHVFPWGHGFGRWFADLAGVTNRDLKAGQLADLVRRFRASQPADPVFLVAKSGGCGVAVKALERLDPDSVVRAILLAPALSPDYDLTAALRAVATEMVVFWSPLDVIVLGAGTRVFGTIDRVRTFSAGLSGFRQPLAMTGAADDQSRAGHYARLRQVRWVPQMAATGNLGGHVGPDSPVFLKNYVLPLLRREPGLGC